MKVKLIVECEIKGVTKDKLIEDLWGAFEEEIDGHITDTYFLVDDDEDKEREVEVNVISVKPAEPERRPDC